MATYQDWNQGFADYFTRGVPRGTKIYLSVDDELLDRIGREFGLDLTADTWGEDFRRAVRAEAIAEDRVHLQGLLSPNFAPHFAPRDRDIPQGIAFLGATVLAACHMADEEEISQFNYFKRLREVLGWSGSGRPPGMETGAEEALWQSWNRWLMVRGFLPTAQRGSGPTTYINYPISQTLLRRSDKDRLRVLFREKQWRKQWDPMTLLANVRREAPGSQHLQQLLKNRQRYEAVAEAVYEVYQAWLEEAEIPAVGAIRSSPLLSRYLRAGLYRTEDPFLGNIDYSLYPKQQRGRQVESISVRQGDTIQVLREERPGWFFPLEFPLNANELDSGAIYEIRENSSLDPVPPLSRGVRGDRLILPQRDFWILIPDPDNPDSGAYASWGTPPLGTPFILLCKQELLPDLQRLRDERLIEWTGEPISPFDNSDLDNSDWVELDQCMVISQAWDAVFVQNSELKDALQPIVRLSISLSGGLRVPQENAWLEEYPPEITVFGFSPMADLKVTRISDNISLANLADRSPPTPLKKGGVLDLSKKFNDPTSSKKSVKTNQKMTLEFPGTGDYLIEATAGSASTEKFFRILPWSKLAIASPQRHEQLAVGSGYRICGSIIEIGEQ